MKPYQSHFLTRSLSLLCASHTGKPAFFEQFRSLARRFDGVDDVLMLEKDSGRPKAHPGETFTATPISVFDDVVGELRIYFRAEAFRETSPAALARFLARQLETAIRGAGLHSSNTTLKARLADLESEVQEHKLFERARGIIESQRLIPAGQGARLLNQVSRNSGKRLSELAGGILKAAEKNPWRFRKEFLA